MSDAQSGLDDVELLLDLLDRVRQLGAVRELVPVLVLGHQHGHLESMLGF
jgi:hypothetical protein